MYTLKSNKRMMKLTGLVLLCLTMLMTLLGAPAPFQSKAHAAGELKPFPQQVSYPGIIKPNHVTQAAMNSAVSSYYDYWKGKYLKNNLSSLPGGYYVKGESTGDSKPYTALGTSEGQGYGMVITALMAGYDSNAKTIYDGLFKTARAFKSKNNANLMGWIVADSSSAQGYFGSATDGDLDIAYSLILADRQWGSSGTINYLAEAKKMITNGIKVSNVTTNNRLNLADDSDGKNTFDTRPSDWMLSHLRAFNEVTGDPIWLNVINNLYTVYGQFSTTYSSTTGLISDFVVNNPPKPADPDFLEGPYDKEYNYNASRVPLRIVMDYAFYGDTRGRDIANKMAVWIKGKTSGVPGNIKDGYQLNGTARGSYATAVFVSPFISAATTNSAHQAWVNSGWDWMKNKKEGYFSDSFNLLNMLFISGNWWIPTADGGTPTPDTQAPTTPTNLTTTVVSSNQINLNWTASTDNVGVVGYQVFRGSTQVGTPTGTTFNDTGLTASTAYSYKVKAVDAAGNLSANSNTATATTTATTPTPDTQAPTAPSNLTTTVISSNQINLNWTASTDNVGVVGYQVFRGSTQVGTPTGTTFNDTGLTPSTAYSYKVKAIDAAGNLSANSNTATATTSSTPTTGTNLALGKTAVASSVEGSGFEASKATDGNSTTRWASVEGNNNEWIYVDLSVTQSVYRVKLNWEDAYAKGYKIQVSDDKSTWTDAYSTTTGDGAIDDITFTIPRSGRYVRVLGVTRGTAYGYSLFDFEVYGAS
ncbi:Endo-1,4-beta-D-glucanase Y [Paenibacillus macquariensis]|uniref:Glucanase n=1 Tax=Paenibacillus macquariensis TaxID=948756 RepID=A0ABY1JXR4_9BACL|nr:Endo-1,4-beta-D-glucanase Y [Paenibacillus macquariensis]